MRILLCMGTRPEVIKMLPLYIELKKNRDVQTQICFSNQHSRMAKEVFEFFKIKPDFSFYSTKTSRSLNKMTCEFLNYFDIIIGKEKPDIVLVHGDTVTAFCASLAAYYNGVRVGHVESGLRTFDMLEPFPEEFYRVSIDAMSSYCFAPTENAAQNLVKEGRKSVVTTGNTVIDSFKYTLDSEYSSPLLEGAKGRKIVLLTSHRRENIGERMKGAFMGVRDILEEREDVYCIFPMHPNPKVGRVAEKVFENVKNIKICDPLPLYDFHNILSRSFAVLTDSGGIQEEAAYLGIPVFLLRDKTERPEGERSGNIRLIGTDRERVKNEFLSVVNDPEKLKPMQKPSDAFGDGKASERIAQILLR